MHKYQLKKDYFSYRNFKLLSFGEEAEENEENDTIATKVITEK